MVLNFILAKMCQILEALSLDNMSWVDKKYIYSFNPLLENILGLGNIYSL